MAKWTKRKKHVKYTRSTIFLDILSVTLLPLAVTFLIGMAVIGNIAFKMGADAAREINQSFASSASKEVRDAFSTVAHQLDFIRGNVSRIIAGRYAPREIVLEALAQMMMNYNRDVYCAWFVIEPGWVLEDRRYAKAYLRVDDAIEEIPPAPDEVLDDPALSPWYNEPMRTREPYLESLDYFAYGLAGDASYLGTISYPVFIGDELVGCIGADVLYTNVFRFIDYWQIPGRRRVLLVADDGKVFYSTDDELEGRTLSDLDFRAAEKEQLLASMKRNVPSMFELHSPFLDERAMVYLSPVGLENSNRGLFMYMERPLSALYAEAFSFVRVSAIVSGLCLVLAAAGIFWATQRVVRPIKIIIGNANRIADGELGVDLDTGLKQVKGPGERARHEVDLLREALGKMVEQLRQARVFKLAAIESDWQKRQMESAAKAQTRFFANMSHEIRTPMNAILGISELLLADPMNEMQKRYVRDIKMSTEALLGIINDILDLSKLESGVFSLVEVHYDFAAMIENICSLGLFLAKEKGLDFELVKADDMPTYLYGDDIRLRQVLLNMLSNAVKYTEKGFVRLLIASEQSALRFDFTDSGIGIREEDQQELFNAFKQFDEERNRKIRGTGLGLSISMYLAKAMGGSITLNSVYGEGSTFSVRVPLIPGDPNQLAERDEKPESFVAPSAKVLIVDDNEVNLNVAAGLVGLYDIKCDTASSGAEAVAILGRNDDYDLIFMDHMMPEMDGIEASAVIRGLGGRCARIPIVALTANAVVEARELLLSSGMDDFLAKPLERVKLQQLLFKWLPREKLIVRNVGREHERGGKSVSEILRLAGEIEGLDLAGGLSRVSMQEAVYEKSLWLMKERIPSLVQVLGEACANRDVDRLKTELHGIKGALANIGMEELSSMAAAMERACGSEDAEFYETGLVIFSERLMLFSERLGDIFSGASEPRTQPSPEDLERLEADLMAIREALNAFNYDASQRILSPLLRIDFGDVVNADLKELSARIDRFDYEGAISFLRDRGFGRERMTSNSCE